MQTTIPALAGRSLASCLFAAAAVFAGEGAAPTWPAFHGPNSSGVSVDAKPPVQIGPSNSVLWKIEVPWSPSSPCIWGDNLFLTTYADKELQTRCYRRENGQLIWSRALKPEKLEMFHGTESSPAASTPAADSEHVVSYFGSFGLICHDHKGKELWRQPLPARRRCPRP
jgi:outer membrane protein assembly factor BamB